MEPSLDAHSLRDREDVEFRAETRTVTRPEFETAYDLESRVTVGITNDRGEVLLVNEGARGWTLPGAAVGANEDWERAGRRVAAALTGVDVALEEQVRVRRIEFRREESDRTHTTDNVLVRTAPVSERPVADEPTLGSVGESPAAGDDEPPAVGVRDLIWHDRVPEDQSEGIATDVRAVLDGATDD